MGQREHEQTQEKEEDGNGHLELLNGLCVDGNTVFSPPNHDHTRNARRNFSMIPKTTLSDLVHQEPIKRTLRASFYYSDCLLKIINQKP